MPPVEFIHAYQQAMTTQQWTKVEPLIHPEATIIFTTGTHVGHSEIQRAFQHNFDSIQDDTYSIENIHWVHSDENNATCIFEYQWEGVVNNRLVSGRGRGSMVLIKEDGAWKLLLEHLGPHAP